MIPCSQGASHDKSDEEMEGEKEEGIVLQSNESLLRTESQEEVETGGKSVCIEESTENVEVEEAANQETEVGMREAETELKTTQNLEVDEASSQEETEARGRRSQSAIFNASYICILS